MAEPLACDLTGSLTNFTLEDVGPERPVQTGLAPPPPPASPQARGPGRRWARRLCCSSSPLPRRAELRHEVPLVTMA